MVEASITPAKGGLEYKIMGIMVNDYYSINTGLASVAGFTCTFERAEDETEEIQYDDLLTLRSKRYRIFEIKPDGTVWVVLGLKRQSYYGAYKKYSKAGFCRYTQR